MHFDKIILNYIKLFNPRQRHYFMSSPIPEKSIDRMIRLTLTGNYNSACQLLNQCEISHRLFEKVQEILSNPIGVSAQEKHTDMKGRIVAVLNSPATVPLELAGVEKPLSDPTHFCMAPPEADFFSNACVPSEIIRVIFLNGLKIGVHQQMLCLNRKWNECQTSFKIRYQDLIKTGVLTIIDAKMMGFTVDDEPRIDQVMVAFHCDRLTSSVMNKAGFSVVTIPQRVSIHDYVMIAREQDLYYGGTGLLEFNKDANLYTTSVPKTYRALMPNHVFEQTLSISQFENMQACINNLNCEVPKVHEYFFQLTSIRLLFNRSAYADFHACCSTKSNEKHGHAIDMQRLDPNVCLNVCGIPVSSLPAQTGAGGVIRFEGKPDKK